MEDPKNPVGTGFSGAVSPTDDGELATAAHDAAVDIRSNPTTVAVRNAAVGADGKIISWTDLFA